MPDYEMWKHGGFLFAEIFPGEFCPKPRIFYKVLNEVVV